jgi:hypothetical protein
MATHPEELRAAIDRGAARDKVATHDPAAAPLGTDEEAAGTPVPSGAIEAAAEHELRGPPRRSREGHEPFFPTRTVLVLAAVLLVLAAVAAGLY